MEMHNERVRRVCQELSSIDICALVTEVAIVVFNGLAFCKLAKTIVNARTTLDLQGQVVEELDSIFDFSTARAYELCALIASKDIPE